MRMQSIYVFTCLCGKHHEMEETAAFTCSCGRRSEIAWGAEADGLPRASVKPVTLNQPTITFPSPRETTK